ncbi:outer membrane protein assembly factor BamD [Telluribacter sp.]|jgi:outer membrane protein assembly factor BamD|uniref:outer membrane protein assembly factor BamD n=1 Tax=Telluribacter sp. TaxID=1978767 RepID=UPI002E131F31|nr:outer membrane protein assembly factor BamD [Telluribacter sp.]
MRKNKSAGYLLLIITLFLFTSCSKFAKLQKSGTDEKKYEAAVNYYKKGDFYKAGLLFEELIPILKGSTESEMAQFYYAYTQYHQGLYNMSQYLFKKFYDTYARSDYAQEAFYMHAYSLYKDSAPHSLDQASTLTAISAMQDFINTYPESPFRNECTRFIMELRNKLELKAYEKARLYYKISDFNLASLKSAVISIDNFQKDFPDSNFNEELSYLRVDAQYNLAKSSFANKQKERYEEAVKYYQTFIDKYPQSRYVRDAEKLYGSSQQELERIATIEKARQKKKEEEPTTKPARVTTSEASSSIK